LVILILFIGIGGVLGLGHAILREMTDDVVRVPDDLRTFDAIRRVTVIPRLRQTELRIEMPSNGHAQPSYRANCPPVYDAMSKLAVGMLETLNRRGRRLIGVVSPQNEAGTSLIAAQLARVLADTGGKVCLVDANWQSRSVDAALSSGLRYGELTGWMERTRSAIGRMDLLTLRAAGPVPDLAASLSIVAALDSVGPEHQWIIVDFHAVAQMVDLEAAINQIDQVVVIIEAERTTRQDLRDLLDIVSPLKLAGIVLNKAALKRRKSTDRKAPPGGLKAIASATAQSRASELAVRSG
jgi:Mrp family chromosome partitioning ATPase